jgi:hypothetical protein
VTRSSKKPKTWVLQAQLISILRRLFVKSPMFQAVRKEAQRERTTFNKDGSESKARRVEYRCEICGKYFCDKKVSVEVVDKKGKKKQKQYHAIAVDHVEPFIPETGMPRLPDGSIDWNPLIKRMFLDIEVWQPDSNTFDDIRGKARLLCYECHSQITQVQNAERRKHRKNK